MSSRWQAIQAHRQQREIRAAMVTGDALNSIRRRSFDGLGLPALPAVGSTVGDVHILNADGTVREVVSAAAFRARRSQAEDNERKVRRSRRRGADPVVWRRRRNAEDANRGEVGDV